MSRPFSISLYQVDVKELVFDLLSMAVVFLMRGPAEDLVAGLARSAHSLSMGAAWAVAITFGVLFAPAPFLTLGGGKEDETPFGALAALCLVPGVFAIFVLPPLVLEQLAASPHRGNAALGSIFGLLVLNLILMAVMLSGLDALVDRLDAFARDHGMEVSGGFARLLRLMYFSLILPQLLWLVVLLDIHAIGMVVLVAFRISYTFMGPTSVVNLMMLGASGAVWFGGR